MIAGIILAAGESKRFSTQNKLLYELNPGISVIESVLIAFMKSDIHKIVIVTGHESTKILEKIDKYKTNLQIPVTSIFNENYISGGMSSSVKSGLKSVTEADAVLITPADIPLIPTKTINAMIEYFFRNTPDILIPTFNNRKGHPILFKSTLFAEILAISEKLRGLKEITTKYRNKVVFLPTNNPGILKDLDTLNDLNKFSDNSMNGKNSL
ncbi:MAG: nucleotidyltransferase family protein [Candidatus Hodarchaeales archaeon]|jgi:molybdenum cofactor cytidylyltransferase